MEHTTITINNNNVRVYHKGSLIVGKTLQDIPSINENNLIVGKADKKGFLMVKYIM